MDDASTVARMFLAFCRFLGGWGEQKEVKGVKMSR